MRQSEKPIIREYQRLIVEKLARAAYEASFGDGDAKIDEKSRWESLSAEAKEVCRRIGAAVYAVAAEDIARQVRWSGAHQDWCGLFGEMLDGNDAEIHRIEPFMLRHANIVASSIIERAERVKDAAP